MPLNGLRKILFESRIAFVDECPALVTLNFLRTLEQILTFLSTTLVREITVFAEDFVKFIDKLRNIV